MKAEFLRVIAASPEDRRGLYLATANRLGTIFRRYRHPLPICQDLS